MKNIFYFLSLLLFIGITSCSSDDDGGNTNETPKNNAKAITGFKFNADDNDQLDENITAVIDENNKTITAAVPYGTDITALLPTIEVSEGATVSPEGAQDFSSEVIYTVTAEDGTKADYIVTVTITPNNEAKILSFAFLAENNTALEEDVTATIDEDAKTIVAQVPYDTDITALITSVDVSPGATFIPEGPQDFSSEITYTVTAQDGTKAEYTVTVTITPNNEAKLLSFVFLAENNPALEDDVIATIDEATKTITAEVPYGTDVTGLSPTLEVSPDASFTPEGAQDFSSEVVYTVTAQDESTTDYIITIEVTAPSQREVLIAIYNANPGNTLGWDLEDPDINNWEGVTINEGGNLTELNIRNRNLINIPAEIGQLSNLEYLDLTNNQLTSIPIEIWDLSNLTELNLDSNQLTYIPAEIGQLSNLTYLNLEDNQVTSIPVEIGQLSQLKYLILRSNQLTSVPSEIGQLANLIWLVLHNNKLTSVPAEIGQLANLSRLYLGKNQLTDLPVEIGQLSNLKFLDLYNIQLTAVPVEIGQLANLNQIDLRFNELTSIPQEVCNLETDHGTEIHLDAGVTCE